MASKRRSRDDDRRLFDHQHRLPDFDGHGIGNVTEAEAFPAGDPASTKYDQVTRRLVCGLKNGFRNVPPPRQGVTDNASLVGLCRRPREQFLAIAFDDLNDNQNACQGRL